MCAQCQLTVSSFLQRSPEQHVAHGQNPSAGNWTSCGHLVPPKTRENPTPRFGGGVSGIRGRLPRDSPALHVSQQRVAEDDLRPGCPAEATSSHVVRKLETRGGRCQMGRGAARRKGCGVPDSHVEPAPSASGDASRPCGTGTEHAHAASNLQLGRWSRQVVDSAETTEVTFHTGLSLGMKRGSVAMRPGHSRSPRSGTRRARRPLRSSGCPSRLGRRGSSS